MNVKSDSEEDADFVCNSDEDSSDSSSSAFIKSKSTFKKKLQIQQNVTKTIKDIWYPNGILKKILPDGMLIRMLYYNKDIKEKEVLQC